MERFCEKINAIGDGGSSREASTLDLKCAGHRSTMRRMTVEPAVAMYEDKNDQTNTGGESTCLWPSGAREREGDYLIRPKS